MKQFKNRREQVEAEFVSFMVYTIRNCVRNAVRRISAEEMRNSGISLETLDDESYAQYLTSEDEHDFCDCYGIMNIQIPINADLVNLLFEGLTEREKQALILKVGFDYDYEEIGMILGIDPMRAKDYKYQGLKKARKKRNGREKQGGL